MNRATIDWVTTDPLAAGLRRATRAAALLAACVFGSALAQAPATTAPSRQTLEEAARASCDGVSVIVQRCASQADDPAPASSSADPLTKSRAATKAAFDRRDRQARDAAMKGEAVPKDTPVGDAQRLGGVTVTGAAADRELSVEEVLQRALNPGSGEVPGPNGTVSRYGMDGTRYDCISKCVGPACCATVRSLPNPARDSNSIGR